MAGGNEDATNKNTEVRKSKTAPRVLKATACFEPKLHVTVNSHEEICVHTRIKLCAQ